MCQGSCSCQLERISQLEEELAAAKQKILDLLDHREELAELTTEEPRDAEEDETPPLL